MNTNVAAAMVLLVLGNLFVSFGDVIIKVFGSEGGIFQYLWLRQMLTLVLVLPFWSRQPRAARRPGSLKIHFVRAHLSILGAACTVVALLNLNLATANVIFYAAPVLTLLLAWVWLGDSAGPVKTMSALIAFAGVIIALRPQQFHWAAAVALVVAFSVAVFNLLVRKLPRDVCPESVLFWTNMCALPLSTILAISYWTPLTWQVVVMSCGATIAVGVYQFCAIVAFRRVFASSVAIAEYSGLIFVTLLGYWILNEHLDVYTAAGLILIILPIVIQGWLQGRAAIPRTTQA